MAKKELNNTQIVIFYYKIAYVLCKQKSMFDKALLYLDSTKLITSHHNFAKYEAQVAMLQSEIFNKQKKYSECLKTIDVAKNIFITINDNEGIVKCFSDKANCLVALGKTNDALLIYKEGIKFSENNSCYLTIPTLLHNIGSLYYDINLDSSELYLTKAILEAKKINDHHILGYAFANLAELDLLQKNMKQQQVECTKHYKHLKVLASTIM